MPLILLKPSNFFEQIYHELMNTPPDFDPRDEEREILGDDPPADTPEDDDDSER